MRRRWSMVDRPVSGCSGGRSLRGWVVLAVAVLTVLTVATAYADEMPEMHRLAAPLAAAVMAGAWAVELAGLRWPRLALVLAMVLPNLCLSLMHHGGASFLFLPLVVAWSASSGAAPRAWPRSGSRSPRSPSRRWWTRRTGSCSGRS